MLFISQAQLQSSTNTSTTKRGKKKKKIQDGKNGLLSINGPKVCRKLPVLFLTTGEALSVETMAVQQWEGLITKVPSSVYALRCIHKKC